MDRLSPRATAFGATLACLILTPLAAQKQSGAKQPAGRKIEGPIAMVHPKTDSPLVEVAISKDGSTSVVLTEDDRIRFRKLADHLGAAPDAKIESDKTFRYGLRELALAPRGDYLLAHINSSSLAIINQTPRIQFQLRGMPGLQEAVVHPDGVHVLAMTSNGMLRLWDAKKGRSVSYPPVPPEPCEFLGLTPDGKMMVTISRKQKLQFYGFPKGEQIRSVQLPHPATSIAFRPDGNTFGYAFGKDIYIRNTTTLEAREKITLSKAIDRIAFHPMRKYIAAGFQDGHVAILDANSGKQLHAWPAHRKHELCMLRFVQVKKRDLLVTAAAGDDVVYWDMPKLLGAKQRPSKKRRRRRR